MEVVDFFRNMSDAKRKGLRTALQLAVTLSSTGAVFGLLELLEVDVTAEQWGVFSGLAMPFMVTLINALEDKGTIPAVLKAPASPGADPIPDPEVAGREP